jgi:hypothetical protein
VFPPLVIGMTEVGEKTGHEPEIFRELARVLDRRARMARNLRARLAEVRAVRTSGEILADISIVRS